MYLDLSGNRLLNLPCTLLDCDLKAIWLAENQAQPMLKFATDIDIKYRRKSSYMLFTSTTTIYNIIDGYVSNVDDAL